MIVIVKVKHMYYFLVLQEYIFVFLYYNSIFRCSNVQPIIPKY